MYYLQVKKYFKVLPFGTFCKFLIAAQCHPNEGKKRSVGVCCQACELTNQIFPDTDSKNNAALPSQTLSLSALNISKRVRQGQRQRDRLGYYDRPALKKKVTWFYKHLCFFTNNIPVLS